MPYADRHTTGESDRAWTRTRWAMDPERRSRENATYWANNGDRIRALRKIKYNSDPAYREAIKASNRRSYHRNKG